MIRNTGFVRNLIGHIQWHFLWRWRDYSSRVHTTQSVSAVFCPLFYYLPSVKHHCKLQVPETWMRSAM